MELKKVIKNGRKKILIVNHTTGVDKRKEAAAMLIRDKYDLKVEE